MKRFLSVCLLMAFVLSMSVPVFAAFDEDDYIPTSIDATRSPVVSEPVVDKETAPYSGDEILKEASNGKYRAVTLDEAVVIINRIAVKLIQVLNMISLPMLVILFIVGALILGIGCISGNRSTRTWGSGTMIGSIFIFALIRLAPIILATIEGIMQ